MRGVEYGTGQEHDRPYICLQDLELTLPRVAPNLSRRAIQAFEDELYEIEAKFAPQGVAVTNLNAAHLGEALERRAFELHEQADGKLGVIYMDGDVGRADTKGARLNLSRALNGEVVERIGTSQTPDQQFLEIERWREAHGHESLLLVDDVLAFGDTLQMVAGRIKEVAPKLVESPIKVLTGVTSSGGVWRGLETAQELGFDVEYIQKANAGGVIEGLSKGLAIPTSRDLTLFGGKVGTERLAGFRTSHPYLWPFADAAPSIIDVDRRKAAATELLDFNERLIEQIDASEGTPLTLGTMAMRGFGIPAVNAESGKGNFTQPSQLDDSTTLAEYIAEVRSVNEL